MLNDGQHKDAAEVLEILKEAGSKHANLLLNIGPLPDGSINPEDVTILKKVGALLREKW